MAVVHFGTGAFALTATGETPLRHGGLLSAVAWSSAGRSQEGHEAGRRHRHFQLEGSVNSAGSAVDWALRIAGGAGDLTALGDALSELGDGELDPERLPDFLPGFVGVGAPWWHPHPGATFAGLALTHDARDLQPRCSRRRPARRRLTAALPPPRAPAVVRASGGWPRASARRFLDDLGLPGGGSGRGGRPARAARSPPSRSAPAKRRSPRAAAARRPTAWPEARRGASVRVAGLRRAAGPCGGPAGG